MTGPPIQAERPIGVVVIDDNRDLAENLAEILEARGYDVAVATRGREGLALCEERAPDVCLVDLNLPDMHGLDVLAELRESRPDCACVVLTGYAALESAIEALNRGAFAYGMKGLRFDDVLASVDRAAEQMRMRRAQRELEATLRDERALLAAVIDDAPLALLVARGGRVERYNQRWAALLEDLCRDRGPEEQLTVACLVELASDRSSREALEALARGRLAEADVRFGPANARRVLRVFAARVAGPGPASAERVVIVADDVTQRRALQLEAERASRLAAIGELAARIAHEIRNPLAGIAGAIRVLSKGFSDDPARRELADELLKQVGRLNDFVEDLLVMARPIRPQRAPVALEQLLSLSLKTVCRSPLMRRVEVVTRDESGGPIPLDSRLFPTVIENLVLNAAQSMGGRGTVRIHARRDGAEVAIRFEDDGPGIDPAILPVIFQPFETTRLEGTGLGLSTSKRIVEAHGGSITASNLPGGGACFEVRLPME